MESGLFLEGGAALTAGDLHRPLPSGHPKLLAAGRALEDLILFVLLRFTLPAAPLMAKAGGFGLEHLVLLPALGDIAGEGPEHIDAHCHNKDIIKEGLQASCRQADVEEPAGQTRPHNRSIELIDAISSGKQTCKHHSHDRFASFDPGSASCIGPGPKSLPLYNIVFRATVNGSAGLFTKR